MLENLFEAIDDSILSADLKADIEKSFNEAVEAKVSELVTEKEKELEAKADTFVEAEIAKEVEALKERVDSYLELTVEKFVTESEAKLEESLKTANADMVIEAFDSMILATGVKLADIKEARVETPDAKLEAKLDEKTKEYDALVEEMLQKDKKFDEILKAGVISEMKEGLSLVEAEKFDKLANTVTFTRDEAYAQKLEVIKESVIGSKETKETKVDETLNENLNQPSWKRFV